MTPINSRLQKQRRRRISFPPHHVPSPRSPLVEHTTTVVVAAVAHPTWLLPLVRTLHPQVFPHRLQPRFLDTPDDNGHPRQHIPILVRRHHPRMPHITNYPSTGPAWAAYTRVHLMPERCSDDRDQSIWVRIVVLVSPWISTGTQTHITACRPSHTSWQCSADPHMTSR